MRIEKWFPIILLLCCATFDLRAADTPQNPEAAGKEFPDPKNPTELFGENNVTVLKHPDHVYAVLLNHDRHDESAAHVTERTSRIEMPRKQAEAATQLLFEPESYRFQVTVGCLPSYGARFIFIKGDRSIAVDFCFTCGILLVRDGDTIISSAVLSRPPGPDFEHFFTRLFPTDEALKKLATESTFRHPGKPLQKSLTPREIEDLRKQIHGE